MNKLLLSLSSTPSTSLNSSNDNLLKNVLITIFYSLIVIVSMCGNTIVCKTYLFQSRKRSSTNILIGMLAFNDLMMTIFNIPFTIVDLILTDWIFGQFFCTFVSFVQANCVYVSSFTMALIALYRWNAIYKMKKLIRSNELFSKFVLSVLLIWMFAFCVSLPHTIFNKVIIMNTQRFGTVQRCLSVFSSDKETEMLWRKILTIETFLTQYIIPLSLAWIIYLRIGFTIYKQNPVGQVTQSQSQRLTDKKRRRIIMLILIVSIFALCWLPLNIYYLVIDFNIMNLMQSSQFKQVKNQVFLICHWFAMSSVCYNPFVYCWLNEEFKNEVKKVWKFMKFY